MMPRTNSRAASSRQRSTTTGTPSRSKNVSTMRPASSRVTADDVNLTDSISPFTFVRTLLVSQRTENSRPSRYARFLTAGRGAPFMIEQGD